MSAVTTTVSEDTANPYALSHLDSLESEAVHIFREVAGEFERPVILFSGGKDSIVMLHLALKAFAPAPVPFTLLHVDTGHNFPEVLDYRDRTVKKHGLRLHVASVQEYIDAGKLRERPDGTRNPLQTVPLTEAIQQHRFDAVFGGGRRDEEKARAKERVFSLRDEFSQWDPRRQRPSCGSCTTAGTPRGARPGVPDLELDRAGRLAVHRARGDRAAGDLFRARARGVQPQRHVAHRRPLGRPKEHEPVQTRLVRYRTVGDMSCTGAVDSDATTLDAVITEIAASRLTERGATRADDKMSEAAMEDRKREGYF